jgi:hypothetical protein
VTAGGVSRSGVTGQRGKVGTGEGGSQHLFNREELGADPFVSYRRWLVVPRAADPLTFDIDGRLNAGGVRNQIRGT